MPSSAEPAELTETALYWRIGGGTEYATGAGASGCGDTIDSRGQTETAGSPKEVVGEAHQAATTATVCPTFRVGLSNNGVPSKTPDTEISKEKPLMNFGGSTVGIITGGALGSEDLIKFDLSQIPKGRDKGVAMARTIAPRL